jgi:hypothetical protein
MNIFITLLENVNKSRTSAGNLSLNKTKNTINQWYARALNIDYHKHNIHLLQKVGIQNVSARIL